MDKASAKLNVNELLSRPTEGNEEALDNSADNDDDVNDNNNGASVFYYVVIDDDEVDNISEDSEVPSNEDEARDNAESEPINMQTEFIEAEQSELLLMEFKTDKEAYNTYNDYAFKYGFGVRKGRVNYRSDGTTVRQRFFVCHREGQRKNKTRKKYSKRDYRTGCKAHIQFDVDKVSGMYIAVKHIMVHNHAMVDVDKRHELRSHRRVTADQLSIINKFRESGARISQAIRYMRLEVQGDGNLGFKDKDAYDAIVKEKKRKLDGYDTNQLIKFFTQRQANEPDFYFDVQTNEKNELVNFFWRDARMKNDYENFGDLIIHDTTYRTNKYDMICGPFVGMNHHTRNVMFGAGFLLNETIDSFVWLFTSFLKSTGGLQPVTIMTDQSTAMERAIAIVFPTVTHRLCTWHIGENAKKKIKGLRKKEGFNNLFNYVLKFTDTVAEFEYYWQSMVSKYKCHDNEWLKRLYKLKEMWCPAYSKDRFSGGVLSSQRSESTNNSLRKKLHPTHGLCEFYNVFLLVVEDWRRRENAEDHESLEGNRYLCFEKVKLLEHAKSIYTISVYLEFEQKFIKGASCDCDLVVFNPPSLQYVVGHPDEDFIKHTVDFYKDILTIECTYKQFTEVGILCAHCLRVFHVNNVHSIPEKYILGRWTKMAMCRQVGDDIKKDTNNFVETTVWRTQTIRNLIALVNTSQNDIVARKVVDSTYKDLKLRISTLLGEVDESVTLEEVVNMLYPKVKDPPKKRKKGTKNQRPKSRLEKESNKLKGWKRRAEKAAVKTKAKAQESVKESMEVEDGATTSNPAEASTSNSIFEGAIPDEYFNVDVIP